MMNYKLFIDDKQVKDIPSNVKLDIQGSGHVIILNTFYGNGELCIKLRGQNNKIEFGKHNIITRTLSIIGYNYINNICNGSCIIGDNNTFNGNISIAIPTESQKYVKIGNDNLFATNVDILGCTEHLVYDLNTNELLNTEDNVVIGNSNWIGRNTTFLTKSSILDNSVVGLGSIVTKKFTKSNVMIAGNPARIRREHIYWKEHY